MVQPLMLEGTGEELQKHLEQHPHERFRLILLSTNGDAPEPHPGTGLRRGMFPQLRGLTEEDFKAAEWHGEDTDLIAELPENAPKKTLRGYGKYAHVPTSSEEFARRKQEEIVLEEDT